MANKKLKHKKSRQDKAIALYRKGFSQSEIAAYLGVNQSTVSRYFNNPTSAEIEDFYENHPYGSNVLKSGQKIPFNRRYRNIENVEFDRSELDYVEWYYNDSTYWDERFYNSLNRKAVFTSKKEK